jgi:hypothetical protein
MFDAGAEGRTVATNHYDRLAFSKARRCRR